ncbi:hypothetical protein Pelo_18917 [Pelomyxa schiedti]|nr:hypothetical protein Pelo_18917 [Pelomyxa schiedti]
MATYHANTELASHSQPVASITPKTTTTSTPPPPATNGEEKAAASNPKEVMMQHASRVATRNINAYKRYLVEGIPLQGIGNSDLSVTYEAMVDAIEMTCINTESPMRANIENVETQMRSIVAYINAMIAERHDIVTDYVPIDVVLAEAAPLYTLLDAYGGFFQLVGISAPDGSMIVSVSNPLGWAFQLIQFGFDENATAWIVPYIVESYCYYWPGAFPMNSGTL